MNIHWLIVEKDFIDDIKMGRETFILVDNSYTTNDYIVFINEKFVVIADIMDVRKDKNIAQDCVMVTITNKYVEVLR